MFHEEMVPHNPNMRSEERGGRPHMTVYHPSPSKRRIVSTRSKGGGEFMSEFRGEKNICNTVVL